MAVQAGSRDPETVGTEAVRVEGRVLFVVIEDAVEFVRAGLSNDVDHPASATPELGGVGGCLDAKLLDGVRRGQNDNAVEIADGIRGTVEQHFIEGTAAAGDREVGIEYVAVAARVSGIRYDSGYAAQRTQDVAFGKRVVLNDFRFEGGADGTGFSLKKRCVPGHFDSGGHSGDGQGKIKRNHFAGFEEHAFPDLGLQARCFDSNFPVPGEQERDVVGSGSIRADGFTDVCIDIAGGDGSRGHSSFGRVCDGACNPRIESLREEAEGAQECGTGNNAWQMHGWILLCSGRLSPCKYYAKSPIPSDVTTMAEVTSAAARAANRPLGSRSLRSIGGLIEVRHKVGPGHCGHYVSVAEY